MVGCGRTYIENFTHVIPSQYCTSNAYRCLKNDAMASKERVKV